MSGHELWGPLARNEKRRGQLIAVVWFRRDSKERERSKERIPCRTTGIGRGNTALNWGRCGIVANWSWRAFIVWAKAAAAGLLWEKRKDAGGLDRREFASAHDDRIGEAYAARGAVLDSRWPHAAEASPTWRPPLLLFVPQR